jgi:hypothetical protein
MNDEQNQDQRREQGRRTLSKAELEVPTFLRVKTHKQKKPRKNSISDIPERFPESERKWPSFFRTQMPYSYQSQMDREFWKKAPLYALIYSLSGLVFGLACVLGGIVLFLRGVSGSTSWSAKILGVQSNLTDAAPGVILLVVGLFIIWATRFMVRVVK